MIEKLEKINQLKQSLDTEIDTLKTEVETKQKEYTERISGLLTSSRIATGLKEDSFKEFITEPYIVLPTGKQNEWFVAVPKFIDMNLGWLDHTTSAYNVFRINKYMRWLGDIPESIEKKLKFEAGLPLKVFDGTLLTGNDNQDKAYEKYGKYLTMREGKDRIKIRKGYEFKLLAQLIEDGTLPFVPHPVDEVDLRETQVGFELRDYQKEAWGKFMEYGAVGVFWAYSAGKTFLGLYAGARLKGLKVVVVPTRTLVLQWEERIAKYMPQQKDEWIVVTYHAFEKIKKMLEKTGCILVIFDECQHLPANTFSRFATLKAKYRIGLCLDEKTLVNTPNGKKHIKDIKVGQKVLSWNDELRTAEFKTVIGKSRTIKRTIKIKMETPYGIRVLYCSPEHMIFAGGKWMKAKELIGSSNKTILVK